MTRFPTTYLHSASHPHLYATVAVSGWWWHVKITEEGAVPPMAKDLTAVVRVGDGDWKQQHSTDLPSNGRPGVMFSVS